ncbi:MFS transporter, PPP family, 3-phenylpropionic acid transporter [Bathymodiolus platifrons methanotrophic gill symbiont]|uniref:MFS transporter n=1 Tax=Bathymodiolus platifrons methanotrophic gill symbiont TaxID=113268 RepID=UPI000B630492|nr:MFS transporter [Bathymodiolus platifrons methanotrophic gill symbiont]MCK5870962.1 MFS transporter [Methyloprofundus sp.]GAW84920.1 MFS transporter, PPP family, 3-phenylpropionic acid transporter [Bathymodiolus platifrons methanotrophic gill symbiont]GFO74840.1 MFS transporter, PPP family, 3-phenylpropionic acid transporter [Bathymodiolus platifrons methanotrophic gill symbiont]GFO75141.1 MFS transporter, PPP family, 3-phenylpropionic acid transporter [Bathymodiolus platifrons methanotrophi
MKTKIPYWRLSGFYFFYFATLGGFLPFWSLYLKECSFSAAEIGELTAFMVGTKIIAPNLWGWIADHTGKSLRVIRIASFFAMLLFAGFLYKQSFQWFALVTVSFSFFWNAALPQFEAATLHHLKDQPHRYSHIRLWGSIGFIATVLGVGYLLDLYAIKLLPYLIVSLLASIWLISLLTPEVMTAKASQAAVGIWQIVKQPEVIAFLLVYMLLQAAHGPYYVFFSIYLKQLGYSSTLIGMLWSLGAGAEIIVFMLMRQLLKYVSLRRILLVSCLLSILRWLMIAWYADNMWMLLGAQVLHAATFGTAHVAAIHLVQNYFGRHHQGKGQALYSSFSFGLGGMLGGLYSGYAWDIYHGQWVYSFAAILSTLAYIIAVIWVGKGNSFSHQ